MKNRTYHYWHVFVPGIQPGQIYGYRAFGPFEPSEGLRFDPDKVLLDPYGKAMAVPDGYSRIAATVPGDNCATAMKSVVLIAEYDWEGDAPLNRPFAQTVIYEMHVRRIYPSSQLRAAGRDARHVSGTDRQNSVSQRSRRDRSRVAAGVPVRRAGCYTGHVNYWGYSPLSFFAPHIGIQLPKGSPGRDRRVSRPGQGASSSGHRGDP